MLDLMLACAHASHPRCCQEETKHQNEEARRRGEAPNFRSIVSWVDFSSHVYVESHIQSSPLLSSPLYHQSLISNRTSVLCFTRHGMHPANISPHYTPLTKPHLYWKRARLIDHMKSQVVLTLF
jgi:hypothetical protein